MILRRDAAAGAAAALFLLAGRAGAEAGDPNRIFPDSQILDRGRISVEVVGAGPDLVFVPGLSSSRRTFEATAKRLRGRYRLHLVQVAGFAGAPSGQNGEGPVLEPTAAAIDAYIVAAGLAPAVYVGHSLGGTMGLYLAERRPEHLKKVLMVDSLPFYGVLMAGPAATPEQLKPMAEGMRKAMLAASPEQSAAQTARFLAAMVKEPAGLKAITAWSLSSDRAVAAAAMEEDMLLDLRPGLAAVRTPMTLVYPYDAAMGIPAAQWEGLYKSQYAPLEGLVLVRIDDSRHFVMLDQPARFEAALDAFLAR
jgi:pimeloyl-ACP methyl ester carboxylesterase